MNYFFNFRLPIFILLCFVFQSESSQAQTIVGTEEDDSIPVSFNEPLVSKIDSFYQKFTISLRSCDKPELYQEIFKWYKTCYHYGGNSAKGIDCSHFVNMLYEKIYGVKLNSSAASIYTQCKPVKGSKDDFAEGDLLFFKIKRKRISHIGIYLQHGKFAHASTQSGVIISDLSEAYYKKRFFRAGKVQ